MAYAPYTNDRRTIGQDPIVLGQFREADNGHIFEFADRTTREDYLIPHAEWGAEQFPHIIFTGFGQERYARVLKTVAYIVVDEGPRGEPITEKWDIRGQRLYNLEGVA